MKLFGTGSRVYCGVESKTYEPRHVGTLVSYFTGPPPPYYGDPDTEQLYGVIRLDREYWTEDGGCYVSHLVVAAENLQLLSKEDE